MSDSLNHEERVETTGRGVRAGDRGLRVPGSFGSIGTVGRSAASTHYNSLVDGFRPASLIKRGCPLGLTRLADPYDPAANVRFRFGPDQLHDLSYYKGRLYMYFGVTPALILFWPFAALTGDYLFRRQAAAIFCAIGFLTSAALFFALWRRYFAGVSVGVVAACTLALGLATGAPVLLSQAE